jgi:lysozyme
MTAVHKSPAAAPASSEPPPHRPIPQAAVALARTFEGCKLSAYQDAGGVWTIGYGHTGIIACPGATIAQKDADDLLVHDLIVAGAAVERHVSPKVALTDNQFAALVDFVFNLGEGRFESSELLELLNRGDFAGAAGQFQRWCHQGGHILPGLQRRRNAELALFETPV